MEAKLLIGVIEAAFPLSPLPEMSLHQAQLADQSMSREIISRKAHSYTTCLRFYSLLCAIAPHVGLTRQNRSWARWSSPLPIAILIAWGDIRGSTRTSGRPL
jgi:hypothetical protein